MNLKHIRKKETNYWLEILSIAGIFFMRGAPPPPSRKSTATPDKPPRLVDLRPPLKKGRRLTFVPLNIPMGLRIPGIAMPTFGLV